MLIALSLFLLRDLTSSCTKSSFYLAAPTIRTRPSWYLNLLPEIIQTLTKSLIHHAPPLTTLKAFNCSQKELETDGIHFSTLAGLSYVNFLLEQPRYIASLAVFFSLSNLGISL